jgi:hypothetical protein
MEYGMCDNCGCDAPLTKTWFMMNIGLLVARLGNTTDGYLCNRCVDSTFFTYTLTTFLFGWWGIISFFVTLFILPMNVINYIQAKSHLKRLTATTA